MATTPTARALLFEREEEKQHRSGSVWIDYLGTWKDDMKVEDDREEEVFSDDEPGPPSAQPRRKSHGDARSQFGGTDSGRDQRAGGGGGRARDLARDPARRGARHDDEDVVCSAIGRSG